MTGNHDYAHERCKFQSVCDAICDDGIPVTECQNYWKMDDRYTEMEYIPDYVFYEEDEEEYEE